MNDNDSSSSSTRVFHPTFKGRLLLALLLVLVFGLVLFFTFVAFPFLTSALRTPPPTETITLIKKTLASFIGTALLFGLYLVWYGKRILKSQQYPLANTWVWHKRSVLQGRDVIRIAWMYIALGICNCLLCVLLGGYIWIVLDHISPQYKLGQGITILQEKLRQESKP